MTSSLHGLYNAHRALLMNQAALSLINSNITNMNTEGYSKQRLELSQNIMGGSNTSPIAAAQSGLGSYIDGITRNRDIYLDSYYRKENTTLNYYSELNNNNIVIEDIVNELSGDGINAVLTNFYNAANQLSFNPTDSVARTDFAQRAEDVALKLNHLYEQLNSFKESIAGDTTDTNTFRESKIGVTVTELNTKLQNLADLNNTIIVSTAQNVTPNGLLDERDKLLDQIAEFIPITVQQGSNNLVTVSLNGNDLVSGSAFVGKLSYELTDTSLPGNELTNPAVVKVKNATSDNVLINDASNMITTGKLGALLEISSTTSTSPNNLNVMLEQLNKLARNFAKEVNTLQLSKDGDSNTISLSIDKTTTPPTLVEATEYIFTSSNSTVATEITGTDSYANLTAGNIKVNANIINDPFKIATATLTSTLDPLDPNYLTDRANFITQNNKQTGDGSNALLMAQLRNKGISDLDGSTTEKYVDTIMGKFGVQSGTVKNRYESQASVIEQIKIKRETSMGVNLDEELTDLVKYQRAYEASAKIFNVVNETIQQIINLAR